MYSSPSALYGKSLFVRLGKHQTKLIAPESRLITLALLNQNCALLLTPPAGKHTGLSLIVIAQRIRSPISAFSVTVLPHTPGQRQGEANNQKQRGECYFHKGMNLAAVSVYVISIQPSG
jgi:hypothetical protein